jgi:hypothetical protein
LPRNEPHGNTLMQIHRCRGLLRLPKDFPYFGKHSPECKKLYDPRGNRTALAITLKQNDVVAPRRVLALYGKANGLAQFINELIQKTRVFF